MTLAMILFGAFMAGVHAKEASLAWFHLETENPARRRRLAGDVVLVLVYLLPAILLSLWRP